MAKSTFVYVTYIRTTPERLWSALTEDSGFMKQYWFGVYCESTWKPGSAWRMLYPDGRVIDSGAILEAEPPRRLVIRWKNHMNPEFEAEGDSLCTMELEPIDKAVKLTITHTMEREASKLIGATGFFWPQILCNLKSLVETGSVVLAEPFAIN
jgi:uncharacterized protein YndB with AHSA1/START domain